MPITLSTFAISTAVTGATGGSVSVTVGDLTDVITVGVAGVDSTTPVISINSTAATIVNSTNFGTRFVIGAYGRAASTGSITVTSTLGSVSGNHNMIAAVWTGGISGIPVASSAVSSAGTSGQSVTVGTTTNDMVVGVLGYASSKGDLTTAGFTTGSGVSKVDVLRSGVANAMCVAMVYRIGADTSTLVDVALTTTPAVVANFIGFNLDLAATAARRHNVMSWF